MLVGGLSDITGGHQTTVWFWEPDHMPGPVSAADRGENGRIPPKMKQSKSARRGSSNAKVRAVLPVDRLSNLGVKMDTSPV